MSKSWSPVIIAVAFEITASSRNLLSFESNNRYLSNECLNHKYFNKRTISSPKIKVLDNVKIIENYKYPESHELSCKYLISIIKEILKS